MSQRSMHSMKLIIQSRPQIYNIDSIGETYPIRIKATKRDSFVLFPDVFLLTTMTERRSEIIYNASLYVWPRLNALSEVLGEPWLTWSLIGFIYLRLHQDSWIKLTVSLADT